MAVQKNNAGNQDFTNNADGWDMTGGTTRRKLTVTGADMTMIGSGNNTYTFPAASATLWGDDRIKIVTLSSNSATSSTSMTVVTGLTTAIGAGTWHFKYIIRAQSATATVSLKFAVNHTGASETSFMYNLFFPSAGVTAATGVVDQVHNATTGNVWAYNATRTKNATLGPHTDVDTINADIMYIIEGFCILTNSGDLQLLQGSETATSTTVMAGSSLILFKLA